jgi:hypothetical protein
MKHIPSKIVFVILLGMVQTGLQAQEAMATSGGNAFGSGGSASYSVGQVFYTIITATNGIVTHGVQQAIEISDITGIDGANGITIQCSVFPNPTTDFLTLVMKDEAPTQFVASLYDINGKLLETNRSESNQTSIDMSHLIPATYYLKVIQDNREVKTFKIIKK